jgi:hypothetical protein
MAAGDDSFGSGIARGLVLHRSLRIDQDGHRGAEAFVDLGLIGC